LVLLQLVRHDDEEMWRKGILGVMTARVDELLVFSASVESVEEASVLSGKNISDDLEIEYLRKLNAVNAVVGD
jgi:hypothetical protein